MSNQSVIEQSLHLLTPSQLTYIEAVVAGTALWIPQSEPQWQAYLTPADELFYGGAAGGGKTDLLLGLAITAHKQSIIFRREFSQLTGSTGLIERSRDILGALARYNGQEHVWRNIPGDRTLEFGGVQYERDKTAYQGHPHDLKAFDEVSEFTESQFRFLIGWLRTTDEGQRCRVIATGNPPTRAEGQWIVNYWAPWLDEHHPNPALPGELRWFAMVDDKDIEVDSAAPFPGKDGKQIQPRSRTFIPARLEDNPFLSNTGYRAILQNLPEPLRSQMLNGDFAAGVDDDPWQVIPTEWVRLAQARWELRQQPDTPLSALGVDAARGGSDAMVIAKLFDNYMPALVCYPGTAVPNGKTAAGLVINEMRGAKCPVYVDVIGIGAALYDALIDANIDAFGVNFAEGSSKRDKSGLLAMRNVRAAAYWMMREALDPVNGDDMALPPDSQLMSDLVAPMWRLTPQGVQIESKEDIKKRLGRSPDKGDAVVIALYGLTNPAPHYIAFL